MRDVDVEYAVRDGASIAYEVVGDGPIDLVLMSSRGVAATYPERVRSVIVPFLRTSFPEMRGYSMEQRKKMARALATTRGLHRRDNAVWDVEASRAATDMIPNARFVELPGAELDLFLGDKASVLAEIERFLAEPEVDVTHDRVLATVLFTDIVASTRQVAHVGDSAWQHIIDDHDRIVERAVAAHRGRVVKSTGDGTLATFDGPARAIRCAAVVRDAVAEHGLAVRAGLHTGEIELRHDDVAGIAVHIASRVAAFAATGEIFVSRTVVDLTAGSGITFEPRGTHQLKGVPGDWPIFAAD